MKAFPELAVAIREILDRIDSSLRTGGYQGPPIILYLAGGLAVNYYCGTRYTEDFDASLSNPKIHLPSDLTVNYQHSDGTEAFIYFDRNYNPSLALLHADFEQNSREWQDIGNENRLIHLRVLAPLDLAVSKISRFSEQDREDILALGARRTSSSVLLVKWLAPFGTDLCVAVRET